MSTQATAQKKNAERGRSDLDRRYGRIGISAVAAALPYQGDTKNPAYSPVTAKPHERAEDDDQ